MKIRKEVKIGIISLVALICGYVGLNFLKGINLFKADNQYYVKLKDLGGTSVASPVIISGYKVGAVRAVDFSYDPKEGYGATLTLALDPQVRIPHGSRVKIKTSLLSGAELNIVTDSLPSEGFYSSGDTLKAIPLNADLVETATNKLMPTFLEMVPEITKLLGRLNELTGSQAIDSTLTSLSKSTAELQKMMTTLNQSVAHMPKVMTNVEQMTSSFVTIGRNAEQIKLDSMVRNLEMTTANLQQMSQQLRSTDNTVGLLLNDPSLYNRLDSLASSADALMKDLKANPKRYVHFSIF